MAVTYDPATVSIIIEWSRDRGFAPDLAVCIAWGESELNVDAAGDYENGVPTSHGLYQVNDIHGKPREYWLGYDGAKRSMAQIQTRWRGTSPRPPTTGATGRRRSSPASGRTRRALTPPTPPPVPRPRWLRAWP